MKVICPKCQYENEVSSSPYAKTRVVCRRCATMIEAQPEQGANGNGQTVPPPIANLANNPPAAQGRDRYATRIDPDFDEVLEIPGASQTDYQASQPTPAFEDVLSISPFDAAPPYDFTPQERVTTILPRESKEKTPREKAPAPPVQEERPAPAEPQVMGWPVLPEDSFEFRRTAPGARFGGAGSGLLVRIGAIVLVFGGLALATYYFLGDSLLRRRDGEQVAKGPASNPSPNNQTATATVTPTGAPAVSNATKPATAPTVEAKAAATPKPVKAEEVKPTPAPSATPKREVKTAIDVPVSEVGHSAKQNEGSVAIQVGSYNDKAQADERVAKLKAAGVDAHVVKANLAGKGTWYRVQAGPFTSRAEADRYGKQLKANGTVQDFIVTGFQAQ